MLIPPADLVAIAKATIRECSVQDVHQCLQSDTLLLDIREPAEFHRGHLPGAVHVPRGLFEFEIHGLVDRYRTDNAVDKEDRAIVLYCGIGARSALAAQSAQALGYRNVRSMAGGIVAWVAAGLPLAAPD